MRDQRHRTDRPTGGGGHASVLGGTSGMRWSHGVGHVRCGRCRRAVRAGEAILVLDDGELYCVLCGRRHWARSIEGAS